MTSTETELCPDCGARLPKIEGPTHRYIGASPACWAIFTALFNAGEPPLAPAPMNALIGDAYAAQHPGMPSPQAIQSVAVHVLTLYAVLEKGVSPEKALWVRQRALRERGGSKRERFKWLTPPLFSGSLTVADIVSLSTPQARAEQAKQYVESVWRRWAQLHALTIVAWYEQYVG
ncbi:MAG: DUF5946 family protein [Anaerolineae bacterium]